MSADIDFKACSILERFEAEVPDADVDYVCGNGVHEFFITNDGMTHEVGFTDRVLEMKKLADIEQVVARIAEQIKLSTLPRRMRIGSGAENLADALN
jgi:hypothetical protein